MSLVRNIADRLLGREAEDAIPSMDGVMAPNALIDAAEPVGAGIAGAEDFHIGADGAVLAAAGNDILRFSLADPDRRRVVASFPDRVGALLALADGRCVAGVSGHGLFLVERGRTERLTADFTCPTALALSAGGRLLVTNGSRDHGPGDWAFDLMRHGATGSLGSVDLDTGAGDVLREGLRWPFGVAEAPGGETVVTQSWAHAVSVFPANGGAGRAMQRNLVGYPARITRCGDGGYLLAIFALRTQLVEFVLREKDFREEMIRSIDPAFWIAPAYATDGDYREPLQGGGIRKLGIQKPWAPPRAYGLVVRLDAKGNIRASYHSRVGGRWHGIVAAQEHGGSVYALSKGRGQLLKLGEEAAA